MSVAMRDVCAAVQALSLSGRPLCVHASLRSFGWVEGGAPTIIAGLLEAGCTALGPDILLGNLCGSATPTSAPSSEWYFPRLLRDIAADATRCCRVSMRRDAPDIDRADMGAIPAAVLAMPGRVRGNHPPVLLRGDWPARRRVGCRAAAIACVRPRSGRWRRRVGPSC